MDAFHFGGELCDDTVFWRQVVTFRNSTVGAIALTFVPPRAFQCVEGPLSGAVCACLGLIATRTPPPRPAPHSLLILAFHACRAEARRVLFDAKFLLLFCRQ